MVYVAYLPAPPGNVRYDKISLPGSIVSSDDIRYFINTKFINAQAMYFVHRKDIGDIDEWANMSDINVVMKYRINQIHKFIDFIEQDDATFGSLLRLRVSSY
jgi:hypothetical protein